MYLWIGICIALFIICLYLAIYLFSIKREIRNVSRELIMTRKQSYNRQLTVSLFDRDLSRLTAVMNGNLDYQKQRKLESEQAERQMKQSISDIAHDLRTPLTVIKGNLQLLDKTDKMSESDREHLRICLEKSDTLKTMVDDFFELSVLESDHTPVELQRVNVTNLLMQFFVDHEAVIRQYGLTPEIQFPEKSVFILADEQMLVRMLSNLLNNVVKYAMNSFSVALEVPEEKRCRITFSNGISMERDFDVEHLFDRSYRGDQARQGTGAGLGLYIVKLLAEKQNANVKAGRQNNRLSLSLEYPIV